MSRWPRSTQPHKREILPYLIRLRDEAERADGLCQPHRGGSTPHRHHGGRLDAGRVTLLQAGSNCSTKATQTNWDNRNFALAKAAADILQIVIRAGGGL